MEGLLAVSSSGDTSLEKGIVDGGGREDKTYPRDFFWDRLIVYLSTLLLGIAALDLITDMLRGDVGVACDFSSSTDNVSDPTIQYVLTICSQQLPTVQYLPIYIIVQGLLLLVPHYVWKGAFSGQQEHFLSLASLLHQLRSVASGVYSRKNKVIIDKLHLLFTLYNRSGMLFWYKIKLVLQTTVVCSSFIIIFIPSVFNNFRETFPCLSPGRADWPVSGSLTCVFVSVRFLQLIWACDIVLLILLVPLVLMGLVWCFIRHPFELGHREMASFAFVSGVPYVYSVPKPYLVKLYSSLRSSGDCWAVLKGRWFEPRIRSDFDFLIMVLFTVDRGLGEVFFEGLVELEMDRLFDIDQQELDSHNRMQMDTALQSSIVGAADYSDRQTCSVLKLGWVYPTDVYYQFDKKIPLGKCLMLPSVLRGAVMGFGLRAPDNKVAMEIGFGSSYASFSLALARTFKKVGYVNFDPSFRPTQPDDEEEEEEEGGSDDKEVLSGSKISIVETKDYATNVTSYRVQSNIFSETALLQNKFGGEIESLWRYSEDLSFPLSYVVIGFLTEKEQVTTVDVFLKSLVRVLDKEAVILTMRLIEVEGKNTSQYFHKFVPPRSLFQPMVHQVGVVKHNLEWPLTTPLSSPTVRLATEFSLPLLCGETLCQVGLTVYRYSTDQESGGILSEEDITIEA